MGHGHLTYEKLKCEYVSQYFWCLEFKIWSTVVFATCDQDPVISFSSQA